MARRYRQVGLRAALDYRLGRTPALAARPVNVGARALNRPVGNYRADGKVNSDALAWSLYDQISTLKYLVIYLGAALSQCRLYVAAVDPITGQPTGEVNPRSKWGRIASDIVGDIAGGPTGQAELLSRTAAGLTLVGKFHLAIIHRRRGAAPDWLVLSDDEIERTIDGRTRVRSPEGEWLDFNEQTDTLQLIWRPHARVASQPDSLVLGSLGILTEIGLYTQIINARNRNALLTNSIVGIPDDLSLSTYRIPDVASSAVDPITGTSLSPSESGLGTLDGAQAHDMAEAVIMQAAAVADDPTSFAASMPIFIQGPAEALKGLLKLDLSTSHTDDLVKRRAEARVQFALDNDLPSTDLSGVETTNHWCVDEQTEILTRRGWLTQDQLCRGDEAWTLNHDTGLAEWGEVRDIYRAEVVNEPMRHMQTQRHDSLTTMNHRWPVMRAHTRRAAARAWTVSAELGAYDRVITGAPAADIPANAKYSDALVETVAWFWTEGSITRNGGVVIAQSHTRNPDRVSRIRAALTTLYGESTDVGDRGTPRWRESIQRNRDSYGGPVTVFHLNQTAAKVLTGVCPDKRVSREWVSHLTVAQLHLFVDISEQGDGWHYRAGRHDIWQRDPDALDGYEWALMRLGFGVSRREHAGGEYVTGMSPLRAPGKQRNGRAPIVIEGYTGTLWCPVTPNRTWFARRNGTSYFTGNTAWLQSDERITMHVDPLMRVIVDGFTRIVLRPMLAAAGMPNPDSVMIGYDTSQLTARPNREDDARKTFDRGGLSMSALRKYGAFLDEDGWNLDTDDGRRDFALWLVRESPAALSEPWITDTLGLPPMPGMAGVSRRTSSGTSDPAESTTDTQSPPGDAAASATVRTLRQVRSPNRKAQ